MKEGEYRPHPKFQQFGETSNAGIVPGKPENGFDLAENIRTFVEQARREFDENKWHETDQFNAAEWMSNRLNTQVDEARGVRREEAKFYNTVRHAYNVIAFNKFSESIRDSAAMELRIWATGRERAIADVDPDLIELSPQQAALLDILAEVTNVPHTQGESKIPLSRAIDTSFLHY